VSKQAGREYYAARKVEILAILDDHSRAWESSLVDQHDQCLAQAILREARKEHEKLIAEIPYIGGDKNPMTRHLVRSMTSLALYKAMSGQGKTAEETGKIIFDAVVERVSHLPVALVQALGPEEILAKKEEARRSQERRYPDDWVWEFIEGDGTEYDYGYDFLECGTQKLYRAQNADEFLPFYCYLDFVTVKTSGWGFTRTMTLAEGCRKCDFRFKLGGETEYTWPPPFLRRQ